MQHRQSAYLLTSDKMAKLFQSKGQSTHKLSRVMNDLFRHLKVDFSNYSELSQNVKSYFSEALSFDLPKIYKKSVSEDGTIKFLIELADSRKVEAVLLSFYKKHTLCISSQVGCAMNCSFCFTGKQGLTRNLTSYEIVGQYLTILKWIKENKHSNLAIKNVVFMGQGEPLHNFENVKEAISIFTDRLGLSLSPSNITVSTSGHLPGLNKFDELGGVNLALSLHSTINETRTRLIPINKNYPLAQVLESISKVTLRKKQLVEYEYLLIKNLNDTPEEVDNLAAILATKPHMINIIPFNPFPGTEFKRPSEQDSIDFAKALTKKGLRVCIRKTKGQDVLAACGQLNTEN